MANSKSCPAYNSNFLFLLFTDNHCFSYIGQGQSMV